jgi:cyclopropane-fatty-acyl-phospholipid synthase
MCNYIFDYFKQYFFTKKLKTVQFKSLTVYDENNKLIRETTVNSDIVVYIKDKKFYKLVVDKGELGVGIGYSKGYWETNNLLGLCLLNSKNPELFTTKKDKCRFLKILLMNKNEKENKKKYIGYNLEIGNNFFEAMLDPKFMFYSKGILLKPDINIEEMVQRNIKYAIDNIDINPEDNVLDIGSGWGNTTKYFKDTSGCASLTGIITDHQQFDYCKKLIGNGLDFVFMDYNKYTKYVKPNFYNKIYSFQLLNKLGKHSILSYFEMISANLSIGGKACILTSIMTYEEQKECLDDYDAQNDFILNELLPGVSVPKISWILSTLSKCKDLRFRSIKIFHAEEYINIINYWLDNLEKSNIQNDYGEELYLGYKYFLASSYGLLQANIIASAFFIIEKIDPNI